MVTADNKFDVIEAIREMDESEKQGHINQFLMDHDHAHGRIADSLCRRYSLGDAMVEDVKQEVMMVSYSLFTDDDKLAKAKRLPSWYNAVSLLSQNVIKALSESSATTGSRGMSTVVRRRRALAKFRSEWVARQSTEPTDVELVEAFNKQMLERRSNAARQGMIATVDDLVPFNPVEFDPTLDIPTLGHEDDCPLVPSEAVSLIERGIRQCYLISRELGDVSRAYYGDALNIPPHISTTAEVAADLGITAATARRLMRDVDDVMRDVLENDFGISREAALQGQTFFTN